MSTNPQGLIVTAVVGVGIGVLAYVALRGVKGVAKDVVTGVASAGTGMVIGVGEVIGVPETDLSKGRQDVERGDWWEASFDLPASDFIGAVWDHLTGKDGK